MTEKPADDKIYFSISDSDKNSSEQLTNYSQDIPDSSQIRAVPPINTSSSRISTAFVIESLRDSMNKQNTLILTINTSQLSDNSTIRSIPTNCKTPQLANIVDNSSTNQTMEKIEA